MFDIEKFGSDGLRFFALAAAVILATYAPHPVNAETTQATLLDRIQIEDIMYNYYTELMSEEKHDVSKFYVEDGELVANDFVIKGQDAIRKFFETARDPRYVKTAKSNMLLNNPRVNVTDNTATFDAVWTGITSDGVKSTPRLIEQGIEHSDFVKQDGHWLIKRREIISQGGLPDSLSEN